MTLPPFSQVRLLQQDRSCVPLLFRSAPDAWCMVIVHTGEVSFFVNGGTFPIGPEHILLFPPALSHSAIPAGPDTRMTALFFGCMPQDGPQHSALLFSCASHPVIPSILQLLGTTDLLDSARDRFLEALLLQLDTLPSTCLPSLHPTTLSGQILSYLDAHFREELSLNELSQVFHHIIHVFKPLCGLSPIQYLIQRRIGQAQYLLLSTTYSAGEIAGLVGIPNRNYFYSTFKRLIGMTPSQYRACAASGPDGG